jgi:acyl-homoserine lactone acylase PvdQ
MHVRNALAAACALIAFGLSAAPSPAAPTPGAYQQGDFKGFWNILPPGSNGVDSAPEAAAYGTTGQRPPHFMDQLPMYRDLIYATPGLKAEDIPKYFKDASFGVQPGKVESTYSPRDDVVIQRDEFGVPHIWSDTRVGAMFGSGYAQAEDRLFLMDVYRHIGQGAGASFIGGSGREFDHQVWALAPYKPGELDKQFEALPTLFGEDGRIVQDDIRAYVAGVNAYIDEAKLDPNKMPVEYAAVNHPEGPAPWSVSDVMTNGIVIGAILGAGGGDELDNAVVYEALKKRFGTRRGRGVYRDFREEEDPEAPTTSKTRTPWLVTPKRARRHSMAMPDAGSVERLPVIASQEGGGSGGSGGGLAIPLSGLNGMSNALLVNGKHTESGHPIAVFGPQTGYFEPQALTEIDIHGGPDLQARGMAIPGTPYVDIGRGPDYAWSATSSGQDLIDTFAVPICDPAGGQPSPSEPKGYVYDGKCEAVELLEHQNCWEPNLVDSTPSGCETLRAYRTKVGLGVATATIRGKPVMYTSQRSTYKHEFDAAAAVVAWNAPTRNNNAGEFQKNAMLMGYAFNWFYIDDKDIAYIDPGFEPVRAKGLNPNFPVWAKPAFEWKGWNPDKWTSERARLEQRPRALNQDWIISWNNKQAPGYRAPESNWSYGSLYRSQLLETQLKQRLKGGRKIDLPGAIDAMAEAATTDFRGIYVLPWALKVLGKQKDPKVADAIAKLKDWFAAGAHRMDRDKDGKYEHADAIRIMDAWWPLWTEGQFKPVLGDELWKLVVSRLENGIDDHPNGHGAHHGSAWQGAIYGQVQKDLRRVLGVRRIKGRYSRPYCGSRRGVKTARQRLRSCRAVLAATLAQAADTPNDKVYGADSVCDSQPAIGPPDPSRKSHDQMCWDMIWHQAASAISADLIPWQNRPTFQQAVEVQGHRPR